VKRVVTLQQESIDLPGDPTDPGNGIDELAKPPFPCPNCGKPSAEHVFCSSLCEDEASFVRYFRACLDDGRSERKDIQKVLRDRLAFILGGGYPERLRWLSKAVRDAVIARDQGRCVKCGSKGTQIDHIRGNSNDLSNLQLLCTSCHEIKTERGFVTFSTASHPALAAKRDRLLMRVYAIHPGQPSDDHLAWRDISRAIQLAHRSIKADLKARLSGKHCPVCLAPRRKNRRKEYLRTHDVRERICAKCSACPQNDAQCANCRTASVWSSATSAACASCGAHGTKEQVIAA
jgi:5-methylcytosine-specific restriction endonuclease McrA